MRVRGRGRGRGLCIVLATVLGVASVASPSPPPALAAAAPADGWSVQASPFLLTFNDGAGAAVTSQADGAPGAGSRLSYELGDGGFHRVTDLLSSAEVAGGVAYTVATDEAGRTATVTVTEDADGGGARVAWTLQPDTGVVRVYEAFTAGATDHFLGSGIRARYVDLAAQVVSLKVHFTPAFFLSQCNQTSTPAPFFAVSTGWGVQLEHTEIGRMAFPGALDSPEPPQCFVTGTPCPLASGSLDRVQVCLFGHALTYRVLTGTPAAVAAAYSRSVGTPDVPPLAQYGLVKWRESVDGPDELLDDIDELQARGIPVTSVLLDNPWETDGAPDSFTGSACVGALKFEEAQFGDPQAMIDAVHARGVRLVLWVAPFYSDAPSCPDPGYPEGSVVDGISQSEGVPAPFGAILGAPPRDLDLSRATTRDAFVARLAAIFVLGVDGVKGDRGDETDFEASTFAGGPGYQLHNQVPVLYQQAVAEALRQARVARGEDSGDSTMMFRAGGPGSAAATAGMWGGDQEMTVSGLQLAVRMGQTAGASGFAVWGPDIGGYSGPVTDAIVGSSPIPAGEDVLPSEALFLRWAQFGALTPVMEIGGRGQQQEFWDHYSPEAVAVFRRYALLHYELVPYFLALSEAAHATGAPALRPLGLDHPGDAAAWAADQEYLLGPDLLVAPVTAAGFEATDPVGATVAAVYLPSGDWVDLFAGATSTGPLLVPRPTPVAELPLYLRAGAVIPFNGRVPDVWAAPWGPADLDHADRAGWLWAPIATGSLGSSSIAGDFVGAVHGDRWDLELDSGRRELQVVAATVAAPRTVAVGRVVLPRAIDADALRQMPSGWAPIGGSIGSVIIKVTTDASGAPLLTAGGAGGTGPGTGAGPGVLAATGSNPSTGLLAALAALVALASLARSAARRVRCPGCGGAAPKT